MSKQNVIAVIYDCDKTLIPEFMQVPLFEEYGIDEGDFWKECANAVFEASEKGVNMDEDLSYLNVILRHVRDGRFPELSNEKLRGLGAEITLFPGLPEYFSRVKSLIEDNPRFESHDVKVEHYIISTGLKEMVLGSQLNDSLTDVFASELLEDENGIVSEIARSVGYTNKTRYIFEINKGPGIEVNEKVPQELRRVPFENMIYIGDGPTDVPCFSLMNKKNGYSIAVYNPDLEEAFNEACQLRQDDRVFAFGEADYREGSHISRVIEKTLENIAERIVTS